VSPSNGLDLNWLDGANGVLSVPDGETWTIQTTTGEIRTCGGTVIRPAGNDLINQIRYTPLPGQKIGVFSLNQLSIGPGAELYVVGQPGPQEEPRGFALALLVAVEVNIHGKLIASGGPRACYHDTACGITQGNPRCGAAGGYNAGTVNGNGYGPGGGKYLNDMSGLRYGGGGAGFGAAGGFGGKQTSPPPAGGASYGVANLDPLTGGSGGAGGGENEVNNGGAGGGGGGAIQITTLSAVSISGAIEATGAGGSPGRGSTAAQGGGGGGAGGAILLEAPLVRLQSADLSTNGGGGGGGGTVNQTTAGNSGTTGTSRALGGTGNGGHGGAGGALNVQTGAAGTDTPIGGDVGRIYIRSHTAGYLRTGTTTVSPSAGLAEDLVAP